jgi:hypothetical protein
MSTANNNVQDMKLQHQSLLMTDVLSLEQQQFVVVVAVINCKITDVWHT